MSESSEAAIRRPGRKPWQFGLRTVFLITAAVAVWSAVFVNRRQSAMLESRIAALLPLARELVVDDPNQIAAVGLDRLWHDESRWDVHVPPGDFRLCMATRAIDQKGLAPVSKSAPIASGRHRLTLKISQEGEVRRITVVRDEARLLEIVEPKEWEEGRSVSTAWLGASTTRSPADQPFFLIRRLNLLPNAEGVASAQNGPTDGLLLWIEPTETPKP